MAMMRERLATALENPSIAEGEAKQTTEPKDSSKMSSSPTESPREVVAVARVL